MSLPPCPQCQSEYTYEDGSQYICPECAFEWTENDGEAAEE
ncbi:PhnA Zinc-Ribbon, partial [Neisseria sicca VK64]